MTAPDKLLSLEGKVAVITGAATGIGRETAELFAAAGARVAGGDINMDDLGKQDYLAFRHRLDVSDAASVDSFLAATEKELGGVDILVNSAGIYPFCEFDKLDTEIWDKVQAVNTRGTFLVNRAVIAIMRKRGGGSIVNISSVASRNALIRHNLHYAASKAGVNAITFTIALEQAEHNIRCNAILPGGVATEQAAKASQEKIPVGPITQPGRIPLTGTSAPPSAIANAALFLASDASFYITGQFLAVDGGFLVS
ncbi:MAG: SDR family NAD(P)-dependent oxidoreductase [Sphingomonadaceae bacterium]